MVTSGNPRDRSSRWCCYVALVLACYRSLPQLLLRALVCPTSVLLSESAKPGENTVESDFSKQEQALAAPTKAPVARLSRCVHGSLHLPKQTATIRIFPDQPISRLGLVFGAADTSPDRDEPSASAARSFASSRPDLLPLQGTCYAPSRVLPSQLPKRARSRHFQFQSDVHSSTTFLPSGP